MPQGVAWSGDRPVGPEDARDRLLDATARCIQRFGRARTALSDIAREAGVTRRTVYRYFEDRDALISAALLRGVEDFATRARERMESQEDPAEMVVAAGLFALAEIPHDPVVNSIMTDGTTLLTADNFRTALDVVISVLDPLVTAAGWNEEEALDAAEIIMRLTISWASVPNPDRPNREIESMLRKHLLPGLGLA